MQVEPSAQPSATGAVSALLTLGTRWRHLLAPRGLLGCPSRRTLTSLEGWGGNLTSQGRKACLTSGGRADLGPRKWRALNRTVNGHGGDERPVACFAGVGLAEQASADDPFRGGMIPVAGQAAVTDGPLVASCGRAIWRLDVPHVLAAARAAFARPPGRDGHDRDAFTGGKVSQGLE